MKPITLNNAEKVPFNLDGRKMFTSELAELIHLTLEYGEKIDLHTNPFDVVFYILEGSGRITIESESIDILANTALYIKAGLQRGISNIGKSKLKTLVIKLFRSDKSE